MDLTRPAVALCAAGTQAELERRLDDARSRYAEAWRIAADDYERCIAAHYRGHIEDDPVEALRWHRAALEHALRAQPDLVAAFLPSLYVNLGRSYELSGDGAQSARYYSLAAELGLVHRPGHSLD